MTRQEANTKLLQLIAAHIELFPEGRFGQILHNIGITKEVSGSYYQQTIDSIDFYEESEATLKRVLGE